MTMGEPGPAAVADLALLYEWARRTRAVVFRYVASVPEAVQARRHEAFHGSMLGLLMHSAECYLHWITHVGLGGESVPRIEPRDLAAVQARFRLVDDAVAEALARPQEIDRPRVWRGEHVTLRWLVLHPITHEFHHKGQVASLGRLLGHPVPEGTDLDLVQPA
jgi:uncharacterized damage-inducible protein DinB